MSCSRFLFRPCLIRHVRDISQWKIIQKSPFVSARDATSYILRSRTSLVSREIQVRGLGKGLYFGLHFSRPWRKHFQGDSSLVSGNFICSSQVETDMSRYTYIHISILIKSFLLMNYVHPKRSMYWDLTRDRNA